MVLRYWLRVLIDDAARYKRAVCALLFCVYVYRLKTIVLLRDLFTTAWGSGGL